LKKILVIAPVLLCAFITIFAQDAALQTGLSLKYLLHVPSEKSPHAPVIILLHGYGSDERDLFELQSAFPKNCFIVATRAPYSLPGGGYEWYDIRNGHDGNEDQLISSRQLIEKFVEEVTKKYKADAKSVYLIGFSQGAIMSYEVGLTNPGKIKGIGVLSGRIYESLKPQIKTNAALKQLRIFISHGTADDRIPFANGKESYQYLKGLGLKPDFHQYPAMGHTISNDVLKDLLQWLK